MTDTNAARNEVLNETMNRGEKGLGGKKSHSETSLQHFGEDEGIDTPDVSGEDPGVSTDFLSILFLDPFSSTSFDITLT